MVMVFFILYLTNEFGFSNQTAGAIISLSAFGGILGSLAGGWCSDRLGSIAAQILFLVLVSGQFLILMLADSMWGVGTALFVLMFFNEAVRPGLHAACLDYSDLHNQKRSMGLLRLAINLGMAIGPLIGGFLAEYRLWNWMFILDAATCLISALLLYLVFGLDSRSQAESKQDQSVSSPSTSPWTDKRMLAFGLFYLLTLIVFIQVASTFIKYLEEVYGLSESQIGLITAVNPILIVAIEMVIIKSMENYNTLKTIAVGSLLVCLGFGMLPFGNSVIYCLLTVVVWTLGEIFAFPFAAVYAAELSNKRNRGRYMAFITTLFSVSMILGPIIGLSLFEIHRDLPWYVALGVGVITSTCLWKISGNMGQSAVDNEATVADHAKIPDPTA